MTLAFAYLVLFLGGFAAVLVTGALDRALRGPHAGRDPGQLAGSPWRDCGAVFLTLLGLTCLVLHGLTPLTPARQLLLGLVVALVGATALRLWLTRGGSGDEIPATAAVVRDIPPLGFGQVELEVGGRRVTLAARSDATERILAGTRVEVVDQSQSVVTVRPLPEGRF